ncbi:MAG: LytR C-terminal domain-containing protein [Candidatus Daviesbacteria bacterium]|nr:LytR C-terminal domain-containing protein [Candidatus Daviesbacteria bacterium]
MENSAQEYYLQVLKDGIAPKWPRPEEELELGAQKLSGGYTQHWAYVKEDHETNESIGSHESHDLPPAEKLAQEYHSDKPAILIDQPKQGDEQKENFLELILVKDGHAWSKTESSLDNLDDNLFDILDFAKNQFKMEVEHFMTTNNVSEQVEKKMDQVEKEPFDSAQGRDRDEIEPEHTESEDVIIPTSMPDKSGNYFVKKETPVFNQPLGDGTNIKSSGGILAKLTPFLIPVIIIGLIFLGTVLFKDAIFGKVKDVKQQGISGIFASATPTPPAVAGPTPSLTPTPSFSKSDIQVRVLNGTTVTGVAKTLAEKLKTDGWVILTTGNNSNQSIAQTTISGKKGKDDVVSAMVKDLAGEFEATIGANLKDSDKADLEVVIGKK